ncbi:hypothetical protein [Palleronia pelagia]|uniref:hypothetical protein n=1 Tax=Palleronia pelagia TaxID=387096 RepID=UPI0011144B54|nr:hypothetical protein [Palleronia pelagia]
MDLIAEIERLFSDHLEVREFPWMKDRVRGPDHDLKKVLLGLYEADKPSEEEMLQLLEDAKTDPISFDVLCDIARTEIEASKDIPAYCVSFLKALLSGTIKKPPAGKRGRANNESWDLKVWVCHAMNSLIERNLSESLAAELVCEGMTKRRSGTTKEQVLKWWRDDRVRDAIDQIYQEIERRQK